MNTTNIMLMTAVVVVAGMWAQKKPLSIRLGVGTAFAAMMLAGLSQWNPMLATRIAILALVSAIAINGGAFLDAIKKATK